MKKITDNKKADFINCDAEFIVVEKEKPIKTMPAEQAKAYVDEVMGRTHVLIDN